MVAAPRRASTFSTALQQGFLCSLRRVDGVQAVAAGYWHSMVMNEHGDVWATGANDSGQLGDGSSVVKNKFVKVLSVNDGALVHGYVGVLDIQYYACRPCLVI